MTIPKPLAYDQAAFDPPSGRWTRPWYDWLHDLVRGTESAASGDVAEATIRGRADGVGTGPTQDLTGEQAGQIILGRRILYADEIVYVRQGGTGVTFGTVQGSGAWGEWQDAIDYVDENIYSNGFSVIFAQDLTATLPNIYSDTATIIQLTKPLAGGGKRIFRGGSGLTDVQLSSTGATTIFFSGQDVGTVEFEDNFLILSDTLCMDIRSHSQVSLEGGTLTFQGLTGADPNVVFQLSQQGSYFANNGLLSIDTDVDSYFFRLDSGTFHDNGAIEVLGGRTCVAFCRLDFFSQGYFGNGAGVTGAYTGAEVDGRMGARFNFVGPLGTATSRGTAQPGCALTRSGATYNESTGEATFTGGTTFDVVFADYDLPDQFDDNYLIELSGGNGATIYKVFPADRLTTGFTIRATVANTDTVWWHLVWLP